MSAKEFCKFAAKKIKKQTIDCYTVYGLEIRLQPKFFILYGIYQIQWIGNEIMAV
jgi:hypothetical protein